MRTIEAQIPCGSLISCPWGVPTSVNFFPFTSLRSPLKRHGVFVLIPPRLFLDLHSSVVVGKLPLDETQDFLTFGWHIRQTHESGLQVKDSALKISVGCPNQIGRGIIPLACRILRYPL